MRYWLHYDRKDVSNTKQKGSHYVLASFYIKTILSSTQQIRYKFKREDKENPQRVSNALNNPLPLEGDHYAMIAAAIEADGGL